jgi:hypothetical protein
MPYITVGLTEQARDLLRSMKLDLTTPAGRQLTMSEVLIAALEQVDRDKLLEALRGETPGEG